MSVYVPEFERLGLVLNTAMLTRGTLVTGGSGSGKSRSAVIPLLHALARTHYAPERAAHITGEPEFRSEPAAMLVIDPKGELRESLNKLSAAQGPLPICDLDEATCPPLDFFAEPDRYTLSAGDITDRILALSPSGGDALREPFWRESARALLKACIDLDLQLVRGRRTLRAGRNAQHAFWTDLLQALRVQSGVSPVELRALQASGPMLPRYITLLRFLPQAVRAATASLRAPTLPGDVLTRVLEQHLPGATLPALSALASLATETATSVVGTLMAMVAPLLDPRVYGRICLDPLPSLRASARLSMTDAIRRGDILCYRPSDGGAESALVGRAIKVAFFRATLAGAATATNRLAAYVADEFQRFVSNGATGEASFCDVARAHGGVCVLATQSLSALRHALGGADDAVHAIVANCATRLQFSTTDAVTTQEFQTIVPPPPLAYLPHLLSVRPLSGWTAGSMLYMTPGKFGMGKVALPDC